VASIRARYCSRCRKRRRAGKQVHSTPDFPVARPGQVFPVGRPGRRASMMNRASSCGSCWAIPGFAQAAVGPFYCPLDQRVYLDTEFFRELERRFRAPGDFARAYVIAHEVGHHVQHLVGWSDKVQAAQRRMSKAAANKLSVRLELQADYLAGVWAHHAHRSRQILEQGDVEEALAAATAIGDDRLQREGQGYVVPDSFTHGTSAQRVRWFRRGLQSGDFRAAEQLFELDESEL
jgi:predicted metalloprotease